MSIDNFKYKNNKNNKTSSVINYSIGLILLLAVFIFFTQSVFAISAPNISSVFGGDNKYGNDVSVTILKTLFGGLPLFGSGEDALQDIFKVFNICVLTIGGIIATYTFVLAASGTANKGQVFGGYNATMTPLRSAMSIAFILPIANGYALIQVVVMWLVLQGIIFADYIWSSFVSYESLANSLAISPIQPESKLLARNVLLASLCMSAMQKQAELDGKDLEMAWSFGYASDRRVLAPGVLKDFVKNNPDKEIKLTAGEVKGRNGIADNSCGVITIQNFNKDKDGFFDGINTTDKITEGATVGIGTSIAMNGNNATATRIGGGMAALYSSFRIIVDGYNEKKKWNAWVEEMAQEHANATEYMLISAGEITDAMINNIENEEVKQNQKNFSKPIQYEKTDSGNNKEFSNDGVGSELEYKKAENNGYNLQLANSSMTDEQIFKAIDGLASTYQTYFRAKAARSYNDGAMYDTLVKNANEYGWLLAGSFFSQMGGMADSVNQIALQTPVSSAEWGTPERIMSQNHNSKYLSKLNYYLSKTETYQNDAIRIPTVDKSVSEKDGLIDKFQNSGLNLSVLMDGIMQYGVNTAISDQEHPIMQLKRLGSLMFSAGTTILMLMLSGFGQVTDNSAVFLMSMFFFTLVAILLTGGIVMSYILPMMPALIWLGMCFGWLVMVMQAMIASPLWIVMHLAPHQGDDFIGSQKNGYMLVLSLMVRPPLMVIGFIFSVLAITVLGYFINTFFLFIYSMSQVGTNSFVTALFGMIVVPLMYAGVVYIALKEMLNIMHKVPDELLSWFGGGGPQLGQYAQSMSSGSIQAFGMMNQRVTEPFNSMRHNLAERDGARAQREGNLQDRLARDEEKVGRYQSAILGGNNEAFSGGMNSGGFNNGSGGGSASMDSGDDFGKSSLSLNSAENWGKSIQNGMLKGNTADIEKAKKTLYPVPQGKMDTAMNGVLAEMSDEYSKRKMDGNDRPFSNVEFAQRVNDRLTSDLFGSSNAQTLNGLSDVVSRRTGNPDAGNRLMRDTFKKIGGIANRTGQDYDVVAQDVGGNIASAMNSFMMDSNNKTASTIEDFSPGSLSKENGDPNLYKQAGAMTNAWKRTVQGSEDVKRNDPSIDILEYQVGRGFSYSDLNYDNKYEVNHNDGFV